MKAGQILLPDASAWDRKCQRADYETLARVATVKLLEIGSRASLESAIREAGIELLHVYGDPRPHARVIERVRIPWIAAASPPARKFGLRPRNIPIIATPLTAPPLHEGVETHWLEGREEPAAIELKALYRIGSHGLARKGVQRLVNETAARLGRFRDDLEWVELDETPTPFAFRKIDVWVDPATADDDFAGFTAEALVAGKRVVACRTPINRIRLEGGLGFAVPVNDPNELAHAIVTALFKDETALPRLEASSRESPRRFDPSRRSEALVALYNHVLHARR